jgi:hypothetical protein
MNHDILINEPWLGWAQELQALSQAGLYYSKDPFDLERFERIRDISAQMLSYKTGISTEKIRELFCNEEGYQTPKIDTRAVLVQDNKILLVQEKDERWSLPGGWVDVNLSIKTNTEKETQEEAGLDVEAYRLIAVQDRNLHNTPPIPYGVCKVFVLCKLLGGAFQKNIETVDSGYFSLENLPPLSEGKNTREQIAMCLKAAQSTSWEVLFD